jgi:hypothetical protein
VRALTGRARARTQATARVLLTLDTKHLKTCAWRVRRHARARSRLFRWFPRGPHDASVLKRRLLPRVYGAQNNAFDDSNAAAAPAASSAEDKTARAAAAPV